MDPAQEAAEVAKLQVKGAGLPTPVLEKQNAMELGDYAPSDTDTDDAVPTEEEIHTLRRMPARIPWICFTVAFVELCERFAYYGTTAVCTFSPLQLLL